MKYFRDENNKIFAFTEDDIKNDLIPDGLFEITDDEKDAILAPTPEEADQQLVNEENHWVTQELAWADVEIRKHEDGHARLKGSLPALRQYRNDLRDRVVDGVISAGSKPVRP